MRLLLLLIPSFVLLAQAPTHKVSGPAPVVKNFKESGSPNAPLTLELYTDYQCPSCRSFFLEVLPSVISQYVATGKVRLIHRDFPLPQHAYSKMAARYANAAGQAGFYDAVATQLFRTQQEWEQNGNVDGEVAKVVPTAAMAKIREMVKTDSHLDDTVTADVALAGQDGLNQTPTLIIVHKGKRLKIDGMVPYTILKAYFDELLAKG
jgi:protein-disulfide isomerase